MGQVSGHAARSWHRRRRDQRLGYSALGLGAGGFVLVLAGTLLVTEVVPNILGDDAPAQRVEPASELSPARTPQAEPADAAPTRPTTVLEGAVIAPVAAPAPAPAPGGQPAPPAQPEPPAQGPGTDPEPEPQPQPQPEGPVGTTVDPVVQGVADTAGGATGGATTPLTTPVVDVVDGVTDAVDDLLD